MTFRFSPTILVPALIAGLSALSSSFRFRRRAFGLLPLLGLLVGQTVGGTAQAVPLTILEPDGIDDHADVKYEIRWLDGDPSTGSVSLFYDQDDTGFDGSLIVQDIPASDSTNRYVWNTTSLPAGAYYIYAVLRSGTTSLHQYSAGPISIANPGCLDLTSRPNLVANPGFEEGSTRPTGWYVDAPASDRERSWEYQWLNDPAQAHSSTRALTIANTFNGDAWQDRVFVATSQRPFPVIDGRYLLTAWIRTEGVEAGHVLMKVKYYDADGNQLVLMGHGSDDFRLGGPQTSEWTRVSFLIRPPHWDSPPYPKPARAIRFAVNVSLDHSPGRVWFDDLGLFQIGDEEYERYHPQNHYAAPEIQVTDTAVSLPGVPGWSTTVQRDPQTGA